MNLKEIKYDDAQIEVKKLQSSVDLLKETITKLERYYKLVVSLVIIIKMIYVNREYNEKVEELKNEINIKLGKQEKTFGKVLETNFCLKFNLSFLKILKSRLE
jgi:hypothetical protein